VTKPFSFQTTKTFNNHKEKSQQKFAIDRSLKNDKIPLTSHKWNIFPSVNLQKHIFIKNTKWKNFRKWL